MQTEFSKYIKEQNLCTKSDKILLGISGGIDSVCLFHLFRQEGYQFSVAHCNFQLRGDESDNDELFVKSLAEKHSIPYFSTRFNTEAIAKSEGISIQMAARDLRYDWFREIQSKYKYDHISIAHNSDDIIETFLINLSRGSGIKGFTGIKPKSGNIIRPLLFASRKNIESYISRNGFGYREDSSNASLKYSRNIIRHEVVHLFESINPRFRETMIENINRLNQVENIYSSVVKQNLSLISEEKNQIKYVNIKKLTQLESTLTYLHELLNPIGFSSTQINDIYKSLNGPSGKKFNSPTHRLIKDRKELIIEEIKSKNLNNYIINSSDEFIENPLLLKITKIENNEQFKLDKNKNIGFFNSEILEFPLTIRKWQNGDYFIPLGMENLKKLSDFFIDNKFSISDKENTWILESAGKIVWIIGHRIDNRFKITNKTTSILKIELAKK
jgi:tRNA(Ile)-lysidine synthase